MFATAVVLVVMATPLFGQSPAAKPAPAPAPAKAAADKASEKSQTASKAAPASQPGTAAKKAPAPPAAPTARVTAISSDPTAAKPALPTPAKTAVPAPKTPGAPAKTPASGGATAVKPATGSLGPVQEKLRASKELMATVQTKLPGVDVIDAAGGFTDLHLFVSAAYVSHNLGVKFDALKEKLLNGKRPNLRQAIHDLRPASSAAVEAQRAQYDAAGAISAAERAAKEGTAAPAKADKPAPATPKPKASTPQL
jgi:hypothetical protein